MIMQLILLQAMWDMHLSWNSGQLELANLIARLWFRVVSGKLRPCRPCNLQCRRSSSMALGHWLALAPRSGSPHLGTDNVHFAGLQELGGGCTSAAAPVRFAEEAGLSRARVWGLTARSTMLESSSKGPSARKRSTVSRREMCRSRSTLLR